jgi:hypothetical protein
VGLLLAAVAAVPASTAAPRAEDPVVTVTIDSFTPVAPKPHEPVTIAGKVTNTSLVPLDKPQAIACIDRGEPLQTSAQLAAVATDDDKPVSARRSCAGLADPDSTSFQSFGDQLAPAASVSFRLTVPWDQWKIPDRPGVWVVGVLFRGSPPDGVRVTAGRARTLMPVVDGKPMPRKVKTALVLPLRHRPTLLADNRYANESLAQSMAPNGQLGRELAAGQKKKVTWLVDPAMLDEARGLAGGYQVVGDDNRVRAGTGQQVARQWLSAFTAARAQNPVILLPYGDPDVPSLVGAGRTLRELVSKAREQTEKYDLPGKPARSGLWLDTGSATGRTLAAGSTGYAGARPTDVNLVSSSSWPAADRPSLTSSPVYDVATPEGPVKSVRSVITDSALIAGGPDPATASSPVQVRQRFAAETALMAASGTAPITVVAAPSRTFDSDGRSVAALVQGLSLPWITPVGIDQVLSGGGAQPPAAKPPTSPRPAAGLTTGRLDQIKRLNGSIDIFTSLLTNPDAADDSLTRSLLRATSYSWRGWSGEAQRFIRFEQRAVDGLLGQVHLVSSGSGTLGSRREIKVNLSGGNGQFPLTIANDLDRSVRVGVQVQSLNRTDLRIQPLTTVTLPANGKATFQIHASAEQNGLIRARAQVVSAAGQPVGPPQELVVQAAQYGSVGWILVGAAVALLFGTSLVRIYRRVRSERRDPSGPEAPPGPDPLNPAPLDQAALEPEPHDPGPTPAVVAGPDQTPGPDGTDQPDHTDRPDPVNAVPENGTAQEPPHDIPESLREGVGTKDG